MDSKQELISQVVEAIKAGNITIKQIIKALLPPKEKRMKSPKPKQSKEEQKAYRKAWYEKNREQVILRVKTNKALKKALVKDELKPLEHQDQHPSEPSLCTANLSEVVSV